MIPSRLALVAPGLVAPGLVALSLVACGEVAPVSLSDAGVSLLAPHCSPETYESAACFDASTVDATSELSDASDVPDAATTADAASDAAPHVCSGVYPIAFSCLANMPGCSPCVGGITCCQLDAY